MASDLSDWRLVESDPGVFTELLHFLGTRAEAATVYDMDSLDAERDKGLLFLFDGASKNAAPQGEPVPEDESEAVMFVKQLIHNACGTIALLHVVLNSEAFEGESQAGKSVHAFRKFTEGMPPVERGRVLDQQKNLRVAHNLAAGEQAVEKMSAADKVESTGASCHFIAYVPRGGKVYELDGLSGGPRCLGAIAEDAPGGWTALARAAVQARVAAAEQGSLMFSLMAVREDSQEATRERLWRARYTRMRVQVKLISLGDEEEHTVDDDLIDETDGDPMPGIPSLEDLPDEMDELRARLVAVDSELEALMAQDTEIAEQRAEYWQENRRRRHAWSPFGVQLLVYLAHKGKLVELVKAGQATAAT